MPQPLPPTHEVHLSGLPGFRATVEYSITATVDRGSLVKKAAATLMPKQNKCANFSLHQLRPNLTHAQQRGVDAVRVLPADTTGGTAPASHDRVQQSPGRGGICRLAVFRGSHPRTSLGR